MEDIAQKVLVGFVGFFTGWIFKETRDYFARNYESDCALRLLEGELGAIRAHAYFGVMFTDRAASKDEEERGQWLETGVKMIHALPLIDVYHSRFDSLARAMTDKELGIAKGVVTYYNAMRRSVKEARPDLDGIGLLEIIVSSRRVLNRPFVRILSPTRAKAARLALADSIERVDDGFRAEMRPA